MMQQLEQPIAPQLVGSGAGTPVASGVTTKTCGTLCLRYRASRRAGDRLRACCRRPGWGWSRCRGRTCSIGCSAATPRLASSRSTPIRRGSASVWRRVGQRTERTDHHFANWFLITSLELLAHLPAEHVSAKRAARRARRSSRPTRSLDRRRSSTGPRIAAGRVPLPGLTGDLDEIETSLVETVNNWDGGDAQTLADLRGLVLVWPPVEQFLILTGRGRTSSGMRFDDVRRFQFDLETTGLNDERDRIFMISMRDSSGWTACPGHRAHERGGADPAVRRAGLRARSGRARKPQYLRVRPALSGAPRVSARRPAGARARRLGAGAGDGRVRHAASDPNRSCAGGSRARDHRYPARGAPLRRSRRRICGATG